MNFSNVFLDFHSPKVEKRSVELPNSVNRRLLMSNVFGAKLAKFLDLSMDGGPWLAGGAVRKVLLGQTIGQSDWDIWFKSAEQFSRAETLMHQLGASVAHSSENAISFKCEYDGTFHNVQLIRRRYFERPEQVIGQFDFTICQLLTDGNTILMGDDTALDLDSKTIRLGSSPMQNYVISRLIKYMVYGYYPSQELIEHIESQSVNINWTEGQHDYDAS